MPFVDARDGARIFYRDVGEGRPFVLSHGWPLNADAWDGQLQFLVNSGYRVIAHDRRGHGRSDQPGAGNDMDGYADDLAAVIEALDLRDAILVGHSTGGGEVTRYLTRHGADRVSKLVLISAITPLMGALEDNPDGVPASVPDWIRQGVMADRSQFFLDFSSAVFGLDKPGATPRESWRLGFWQQGMTGALHAQYACIDAFWRSDFRTEMEAIDLPTLVIHGGGDDVLPLDTTSRRSVQILRNATLSIYEGAPHGLPVTHQDRLNADLAAFGRD